MNCRNSPQYYEFWGNTAANYYDASAPDVRFARLAEDIAVVNDNWSGNT